LFAFLLFSPIIPFTRHVIILCCCRGKSLNGSFILITGVSYNKNGYTKNIKKKINNNEAQTYSDETCAHCRCTKKKSKKLTIVHEGISVIICHRKSVNDMNTSTRCGTRRADDWFDKEKNTAHYLVRINTINASIIIVLFQFECTFLVCVKYHNNAHRWARRTIAQIPRNILLIFKRNSTCAVKIKM